MSRNRGRTTILADARWADEPRGSRFARNPLGIRRFAAEVLARLPGIERLRHSLPVLHPLEPLWLVRELARAQPRVYFSPAFNPPLWSPAPVVFTVHDLIHLHFPAESGRRQQAYYRAVVLPGARRAHAVLTVSEFSKGEIVSWARLDEERVVVVGNGVGPDFNPEGPRHECGYPYLLYVGNRKPHKNFERLLEAYARSGRADDVWLVATGEPDEATIRRAGTLGVVDRLVFAGRLRDADLPALYRGATAVVFPSLYEGFGLPALEAMASGVPLLASDSTSLPGVVGDAALLVDAVDVEAIAAGLRRIVDDEALRQTCRERGLERARRFSWDRVAARVWKTLSTTTA